MEVLLNKCAFHNTCSLCLQTIEYSHIMNLYWCTLLLYPAPPPHHNHHLCHHHHRQHHNNHHYHHYDDDMTRRDIANMLHLFLLPAFALAAPGIVIIMVEMMSR